MNIAEGWAHHLESARLTESHEFPGGLKSRSGSENQEEGTLWQSTSRFENFLVDSNPGVVQEINWRVIYDYPPVELRISWYPGGFKSRSGSKNQLEGTLWQSTSRIENILVDSNPGVGPKINWRVLYDNPPVELRISWWIHIQEWVRKSTGVYFTTIPPTDSRISLWIQIQEWVQKWTRGYFMTIHQ